MSTNCLIGIKCKEKSKANVIYCYADGTPDRVGKTLNRYYRNKQVIEELLELGDISTLGKQVAPNESEVKKHSFDNPLPNVTVAYARDRGCEKVSSRCIDLNSYIHNTIEYAYIYDEDKDIWEVYKGIWIESQRPDYVVKLEKIES